MGDANVMVLPKAFLKASIQPCAGHKYVGRIPDTTGGYSPKTRPSF